MISPELPRGPEVPRHVNAGERTLDQIVEAHGISRDRAERRFAAETRQRQQETNVLADIARDIAHQPAHSAEPLHAPDVRPESVRNLVLAIGHELLALFDRWLRGRDARREPVHMEVDRELDRQTFHDMADQIAKDYKTQRFLNGVGQQNAPALGHALGDGFRGLHVVINTSRVYIAHLRHGRRLGIEYLRDGTPIDRKIADLSAELRAAKETMLRHGEPLELGTVDMDAVGEAEFDMYWGLLANDERNITANWLEPAPLYQCNALTQALQKQFLYLDYVQQHSSNWPAERVARIGKFRVHIAQRLQEARQSLAAVEQREAMLGTTFGTPDYPYAPPPDHPDAQYLGKLTESALHNKSRGGSVDPRFHAVFRLARDLRDGRITLPDYFIATRRLQVTRSAREFMIRNGEALSPQRIMQLIQESGHRFTDWRKGTNEDFFGTFIELAEGKLVIHVYDHTNPDVGRPRDYTIGLVDSQPKILSVYTVGAELRTPLGHCTCQLLRGSSDWLRTLPVHTRHVTELEGLLQESFSLRGWEIRPAMDSDSVIEVVDGNRILGSVDATTEHWEQNLITLLNRQLTINQPM